MKLGKSDNTENTAATIDGMKETKLNTLINLIAELMRDDIMKINSADK